MVDDKEIEAAARRYSEVTDCDKEEALLIEEGFKEGAEWAINDFLKDLWHPIQEEPKLVGEEIIIEIFINGERYTTVQKYMVGVENPATIEAIRWISDWDSFLHKSGDDVKMIRWCYFKDLLPKEGGEQ